MASYLVLTNAAAGSNEAESLEAALAVLRASGDVEVVDVSSATDHDAVLSAATGTIVVAGGDGSLHALVNDHQRLGLDAPVGLVPLGTGNDFARGVGLPLEAAAAAQVITDSEPRAMDVIVADDGTVIVNSVHVGLGADAGRHATNLKPTLGRFGYAAGALLAGFRSRGLRVRVTVDGHEVARPSRRLAQVAVANSSSVGGGAPLVPEADPADGALDVVVSGAVDPMARLAYFVQLRLGRHVDRPDVETHRGKRVTVEGAPFHVSADGELAGPVTTAAWELRPAAFRMHV
jgi:diacylglycerol kinase (ATP)